MSSRIRRKQMKWGSAEFQAQAQPLTPLMEGPDPQEMQDEEGSRKESSWEIIREWFRLQKNIPGGAGSLSSSLYGATPTVPAKRQDLRLLLGVLGCPLAPIPLPPTNIFSTHGLPLHMIKQIPIETSSAHYIIQQYLAASGCLKKQQRQDIGCSTSSRKNMYAAGTVKMICCETEISSGKGVKSLGSRTGVNGCFVLWQMSPSMWSLELAVGGNKVLAGSDGKIVWRHTPWLGTHAAKGPRRPLRRIIQGLDPKSTASLFMGKAQCMGEKRIGDQDCFVLTVAADEEAVMERSEGAAEVIRHVLYGYFSQKSGLLIYMEDSHLTRVVNLAANSTNTDLHHHHHDQGQVVYWETTIGSSIGDYRDVDNGEGGRVLLGHQGRTIATVFRFVEADMASPPQPQHYYSRTRMEEHWRIHDVVYDVPGLSPDSFLPPTDIFHL